LIDFGLGHEIVCKGCSLQSVGTPYFIAPEVILGKEQSPVLL
jgi:calcium/calmodulin-dependent protein kinase I